ncbi:hypothetical protein CQW23_26201 [Capsicum baccatum]|uniref:Uncharacterized protein n=1 Tax=Capsicum baccatum TaxID=33114 RepID=A0A2G2VN47_CAPBA|nr:hypothetical protein CQW23_26201 [Capsicum baccatum]
MVCMITFTMEVNKDVINEDYDEHIQVLLENLVHPVHERYWGIRETKGHDQKLEMAIPDSKSYFRTVTFPDSKMMIA